MGIEAVLDRFPAVTLRKPEREPLAPALDAEVRHIDTWSAGRLAYYVDSRAAGRPVVLLHPVDVAASSREIAPLFDALRRERPVYALDLPGFGLSERAARSYDCELFRAAVRRILTDVVRAPDGADVVALSLSSEFAAAVACEEPSLVHSLVLVSPTGLDREAPGAIPVLRAVSHLPFVAKTLFRLVASPPGIRWSLGRSFVRELDPDLIAYSVRASKEPGAYRAPLAFLAGDLFTKEAFELLYAPLPVNTLVIPDHDPQSGFDRLEQLAHRNHRVELARTNPTSGLPHLERLGAMLDAMRSFWAQDPW